MGDETTRPVIRDATPADAAAVLALWAQLARDGESADARYRLRPSATQTARDVIAEQWLAPGSRHTVLVADALGSIVGFLAAVPAAAHAVLEAPPTLLVTDTVVAPSHRGQGVGRLLVEHLRSRASEAGVETIEVGTLAADHRAVAFWHAMGFGPWRVTLRSPDPARPTMSDETTRTAGPDAGS